MSGRTVKESAAPARHPALIKLVDALAAKAARDYLASQAAARQAVITERSEQVALRSDDQAA